MSQFLSDIEESSDSETEVSLLEEDIDLTQLLSNLTIKEQNSKMTNIVDIAFKTQTFIPNFTGNSDELESFILQCDKFHNSYGITQDNNLSQLVFNILKGKLQGAAFKKIACRADLETWPQIRKLLLDNFSDHLTIEILKRDLMYMSRHSKESYLDFLNKIEDLKSKIIIKVAMNTDLNAAQKENEKINIEDIAMQTLKMNIDDHLLTKLDIKETKTVSEALPLVTRHVYTYQNITETKKLLYKNVSTKPIYSSSQQRPQSNFQPQFGLPKPVYQPEIRRLPNIQPMTFPGQRFENNQPKFESRPIALQHRDVKTHFPTASKVFGKNRTQNTNVFSKNNFNRPSPPVEKMSTTSSYNHQNFRNNRPPQFEEKMSTTTAHNTSNFRNNQFNRFNGQQLFNTENDVEQECDYVYESDTLASDGQSSHVLSHQQYVPYHEDTVFVPDEYNAYVANNSGYMPQSEMLTYEPQETSEYQNFQMEPPENNPP